MDGLPAERIHAALEELLRWPALSRSPQLARFLSYIVQARLRGDEANIKAYSIAVDVFGRPPSFDPQTDPIVRVQARRLRALLNQFYDEGHAAAGVRIELPVGRYVPEFASIDGAGPPAAPAAGDSEAAVSPNALPPVQGKSWGGAIRVGAAVVVAAAFFLGAFLLSQFRTVPTGPPVTVPALPVVMVGDFANVTGTEAFDSFGASLADSVASMLAPFEDFTTSRLATGRGDGEVIEAGDYLVSGLINPLPQGVEVTAMLTGGGGEAIWSRSFSQPMSEASEASATAAVARAIVREIAPYRGPVHQSGRRWLDSQARPLAAVNSYVCQLTYRLARETGSSTHIADALACIERLLGDQPDVALALSAGAWLEMRARLNSSLAGADPPREPETQRLQAERAVALRPESSTAHELLGSIHNWQEQFEAAEREYATALGLNPLNTDARAGYAISLSRSMNWDLGGQQAALAIADTAYPSPWYYYPAGISALREGDYERAIEHGREAMRFAGGEIGSLIALTAAVMLGRQDVVDEARQRVLNSESLRRGGIMSWLSAQVTDPEVLALIAKGLTRAGVPESALTGPF
jgi:tetratricopeptide (TPR) repeat protein